MYLLKIEEIFEYNIFQIVNTINTNFKFNGISCYDYYYSCEHVGSNSSKIELIDSTQPTITKGGRHSFSLASLFHTI